MIELDKEKKIEAELVKLALHEWFRLNAFKEFSLKNLQWYMSKLFSFDVVIYQKEKSEKQTKLDIILQHGEKDYVLEISFSEINTFK